MLLSDAPYSYPMKENTIGLNGIESNSELALNIVMPMPEKEVPEWLPMVQAEGVIRGRDGREFLNPGVNVLLAAQNAHGVDVVIDEEHSTELKAPRGESAPAFGWISEWKIEDNVLLGRVEWNSKGLEVLKNKEYRYYSPAYPLTPDREIRYIKSVGLTNTPNLRLPALNREIPGGSELISKAILEALGLKADASEAEVVIAVNAVKTPASKEFYVTSCNSEESLTSLGELVKASPVIVAANKEEVPARAAASGSTELNSEEAALAEQLGISTEKALSYFGKGVAEKKEKGEK